MPGDELGRRLAVAGVGVPAGLFLLYLGGWPLALAVGGIAVLVTRELFALARARGHRPFVGLGLAGSLALVLLAGWLRAFPLFAPWALGLLLGLLLLSLVASVWLRWPEGKPLADSGITVLGALYGGGCLTFALFLRHLPGALGDGGTEPLYQGAFLLAFPLAVTWVGDSAAFFAGHSLGRRKLIPSVSPAKTVEGGVAGLGASILVGGLAGWLLLGIHPSPGVSALLGAGMGLILGVGAQVGDLAESVLKREAGVKDSGRLLPGHGGLLDRFDALLVTLPLAYALIRLAVLLP